MFAVRTKTLKVKDYHNQGKIAPTWHIVRNPPAIFPFTTKVQVNCGKTYILTEPNVEHKEFKVADHTFCRTCLEIQNKGNGLRNWAHTGARSAGPRF